MFHNFFPISVIGSNQASNYICVCDYIRRQIVFAANVDVDTDLL